MSGWIRRLLRIHPGLSPRGSAVCCGSARAFSAPRVV